MKKSHVAGWGSESPTPAQLKEFFAQVDQGRITKSRLQNFLGKSCGTNQRRASDIMEKNFLGIPEVIHHLEVGPSHQQLEALHEVPYSEAVLEELRYTHILAAVFPISILSIRKTVKDLFCQSWYIDEPFVRERGGADWHLIRRTEMPESTSKSWDEQAALFGKNDHIPTARVMAYVIIGHYLARGERLFENLRVRTQSHDLTGRYISLGDFRNELFMNSMFGFNRGKCLGIASARWPDTAI